jgi:crotonobetainyl-CoA:carnitine CoA-transferase CaiB-like acyl-CoA transferase
VTVPPNCPNFATAYAEALIAGLGGTLPAPIRAPAKHPAEAWALSGAMALTGRADGPPRVCPAPLASCADGAVAALAALTGSASITQLRGAALLGERAAITGYGRNGRISPGGACRLLQAEDGWIAVNLARPDDWDLLPALIGQEIARSWPAVEDAVSRESAADLVTQGRTLGLAIAPSVLPEKAGAWFAVVREVSVLAAPSRELPLVVDLSGLWAGPLCGHLLHLAGAQVIKVESTSRPDGARFGPPAFFDLLNGGKKSVALDFRTNAGRECLRGLLTRADIVIESSRPRALGQMGISAEDLVKEHPGLTWISITGYGRVAEAQNWIAFGDDAGVAAGVSALMPEPNGSLIFCGDAIADPLTGMHAALVAWSRWRSGRGGLISIALRDVAAWCGAADGLLSIEAAAEREQHWTRFLTERGIEAATPSARVAPKPARPLGADTEAVLSELGIAC